MAFRSKKGSAGSDGIAVKPVLLAAVLAMLWIAFYPDEGGDLKVPEWGTPIVIITRFFAGFAAGWVTISLAQIVMRLAWLGASQFYARSRRN